VTRASHCRAADGEHLRDRALGSSRERPAFSWIPNPSELIYLQRMQSALISAGVAAVVALLGILANLRINRDLRRSAAEQLKLTAAIGEWREAIRILRKYTADIERLRIAANELEMSIERARWLAEDEFARAAKSFEDEFRSFFHAWADAKGEIPVAELAYRALRHDCKNAAEAAFELVTKYRTSSDRSESDRMATRLLLKTTLAEFQEQQNRLYTFVNNVKSARLEALIVEGALPSAESSIATASRAYEDVVSRWR